MKISRIANNKCQRINTTDRKVSGLSECRYTDPMMNQSKNIVRGYFSTDLTSDDDAKNEETLLDSIYRRIEDSHETGVVIDESKSEIRQFYRDKVVLVTGATGSIGTCVVEKLLRSCPIRKLYLLIRPKRGTPIEERVEKFFDDIFFEEMKSTTPDWKDKVVPIVSDVSAKNLGVSPEQRKMVVQDTNVIIHLAANVKFNEDLGKILRINVLGTKQLLDIAQECRNLQSFIHVSTAYSQHADITVEEKLYDPPITLSNVYDLLAKHPDGFTKQATQEIIRPYPNTYAFSKAIAEHVVKEHSKSLIAGVVRPSIGTATYREPFKGWTNSPGGLNFGGLFASLGLVHVAFGNDENLFDVIPIDLCSNAIIAATWDVALRSHGEPVVYNVTNSREHVPKWKDVIQYAFNQSKQYPTVQALWFSTLYTTGNFTLFKILDIFMHFLPAVLTDLGSMLIGGERRALTLYRKGHEYVELTLFYMQRSWHFESRSTAALWQRLNQTDKALFYFDFLEVTWDLFGYLGWRAIRVYLLKDPMSTLNAARRKRSKLKILHYTVMTLLTFILLYAFWKLVTFVLGVF